MIVKKKKHNCGCIQLNMSTACWRVIDSQYMYNWLQTQTHHRTYVSLATGARPPSPCVRPPRDAWRIIRVLLNSTGKPCGFCARPDAQVQKVVKFTWSLYNSPSDQKTGGCDVCRSQRGKCAASQLLFGCTAINRALKREYHVSRLHRLIREVLQKVVTGYDGKLLH